MTVDDTELAAAINRLSESIDDLPGRLAAALAPHAAPAPARRGTKSPSRNDAERQAADQLREFLADACQREPGATLQGRAFYKAYKTWAEGRGLTPITEKRFSLTMRTLGPTRERERKAWWHGVALQQAPAAPGGR